MRDAVDRLALTSHERAAANGGAMALGHPLGGTGAILMTKLVHHMADQGIQYGLQAICEVEVPPTPRSSSCSMSARSHTWLGDR